MKKQFTTSFGKPVDNDLNSQTAGSRGPVLMQDVHLLEKLSHFDRERIPERVVHAKGAGAYGYFEVTADVTRYTKAKFLSEVGKKTDVFVRFSPVGGEKGSADAEREALHRLHEGEAEGVDPEVGEGPRLERRERLERGQGGAGGGTCGRARRARSHAWQPPR